MMRYLALPLLLVILSLTVPPSTKADVTISGDRLTVSTNNVRLAFRGGDITLLTNLLTGENYVRQIQPLPLLLDLKTTYTPRGKIASTGWRQGANPNAAMTKFYDLERVVTITVVAEPETQDVVITVWGEANPAGALGLTWGMHGLDLATGRLVLPAQGGCYADRAAFPPALTLDYPTQWEAQLAIWEGRRGGFVVYSRDDRSPFKKLHLSRRGDFADLVFETEAEAPYEKAAEVRAVEWRINAFAGDWRVPALGYRNLMRFLRPPVEMKEKRAWVRDIRAIATIHGEKYDPALPEALAKRLDPRRTLLYLPGWRRDGYDVNYPDYTPNDTVRPFIERAHALGFRVMLHTDLPGVSPKHPDYARLQRFQVKDPRTLAPLGWYWERPESDPQRFAYINPASSAYRNLFIAHLRPAIDALRPDALHLDVSGPMFNDGNGPIENMNYAQGSIALHRALLQAFPDLVLGGESMNELIAPYNAFAQRWIFGALPPHPISALLFSGQVAFYGYLGMPNPDQSPDGFLKYFSRYERQGVLPTLVLSSVEDLAENRVGMNRLLRVVRAFQEHDLGPDWSGDWSSVLFRYVGANGAWAALEALGQGVRFQLKNETLYMRVRGVNQLVSSQFIAGWPAYDEGLLYGLDPNRDYWLEPVPRLKDRLHLSFLSENVVVAGAQVTSDFAIFQLSGVERLSADLLQRLPQARTGILVEGKEQPLGLGGTAQAQDITVGGEARKVIFMHPPYEGGLTGESFAEYSLTVPDAPRPALLFAVGLSDGAGPSDGVTFRVSINGKEVWQEHTGSRLWQQRRIDLTPYAGQAIRLRLSTHPGPKNNASWDHAGWSEARIVAETRPTNITAKLALPPDTTPAGLAGTGRPGALQKGEIAFTDITLPGALLVFLKPGQALSPGQSLLDLPHDASIVAGGLATSGTVYGSGAVGSATCGGVTRSRALNAHTPSQGQTIFSWTLKLPDTASPTLAFSAGLGDGSKTGGVGFAVRINGETVWSWMTRESRWQDATVDLSRWRGQTVLVQLVTDALGDNFYDWAKWADVSLR